MLQRQRAREGPAPDLRTAVRNLFAWGPGARRGLLALALGVCVAALDGRGYLVGARLDAWCFDAQARFVRALPAGPRHEPPADIVLVGLDEPSLAELAVPLSLIHAPLGEVLGAVAAARPRGIGLDIALPDRSFDGVMPGADGALMRGLVAARAAAPLVVALDVDADGRLRLPYPALLAAAGGADAFGLPIFPLDCDGSVRRFEPDPTDNMSAPDCRAPRPGLASPALPTFAGRLAQRLGGGPALLAGGWIDCTRGAPFAYVPLRDVLDWQHRGQDARLHQQFFGRVVLIGSVLPYLDRLRLAAPLAGWEAPGVAPPGLVANAQLLRNALGAGLLREAPRSAAWALLLLCAAGALPARAPLRYALLLVLLPAIFLAGAAAQAAGWVLACGSAALAGTAAVGARTALDLAAAHRDRERLSERVRGFLSPAALRAILEEPSGHAVSPQGARRSIALLFADVQDFTRRSEGSEPERTRELLNCYYAAVTPGLHAQGGMIDNFRGDGIMVLFGAPQALDHACDAALAAAVQMLERIERLNREQFVPAGIEKLAVSIGLSYGAVVYGELGSPDRRDFTALGDAVNVAAHLQALARQQGLCVLMSEAFVGQLSAPPAHLVDLGMLQIKGHTPLRGFAWAPPSPGSGA